VDVSLLIVLTVVILGTVGLVTTLALGLGLVPLSGNVTAGRYVKENIRRGDFISVNGIEGTVEELGYASITLRSEDGFLHYIPHRIMLEGVMSKKAEPDN
jgi:small-conductance mechanosensitive channel